jgi:sigma-B regulation protein RsbU (phosphoserine phosphatase)
LETALCEGAHLPLADVLARTIEEAKRWLGHDQFPDDVALMGLDLADETPMNVSRTDVQR